MSSHKLLSDDLSRCLLWSKYGIRVRREGDIFEQNTFSNICFYWHMDQESIFCIYLNYQNLIFVKWCNEHGGPRMGLVMKHRPGWA